MQLTHTLLILTLALLFFPTSLGLSTSTKKFTIPLRKSQSITTITTAAATTTTKNISPFSTIFVSTTLLLSSVTLPFTFPAPANAAYGPSGAAVTSPAVVKPLNLEQYNKLSTKKRAQYQNGFIACFKSTDASGKEQCKPSSIIDAIERDLQDFISKPETVVEEDNVVQTVIDKAIDDRKTAQEDRRVAQEEQKKFQARQKVLKGLSDQPPWVNYAAAFTASVISTLVVHPLDTLKTRLMSKPKNESEDEAPAFQMGNLYDGMSANILKEAPASALYLGIYESARLILDKQDFFQDFPIASYLVAGAAGEFVGSMIRAPAEAVKTRVQTGETLEEAVRAVAISDLGRKNTFTAWTSSLLRDIPQGAIQIAVFELVKGFIVDSPIELDVNTLLSEAAIGGFGGAVGAFVTVPSDVITTTIIAGAERPGGEVQSALALLETVLKEEGVAGLFRGALERTSYWFFAIGIFLSCYCSLRQMALSLPL